MVEAFNDWLFDPKRKPGDSGIVQTNYGFHIMYFVGDGLPSWKQNADKALRNSDMNDKIKELVEKYEVEFDESAFAKFEIKV